MKISRYYQLIGNWPCSYSACGEDKVVHCMMIITVWIIFKMIKLKLFENFWVQCLVLCSYCHRHCSRGHGHSTMRKEQHVYRNTDEVSKNSCILFKSTQPSLEKEKTKSHTTVGQSWCTARCFIVWFSFASRTQMLSISV